MKGIVFDRLFIKSQMKVANEIFLNSQYIFLIFGLFTAIP